MVSTRAAQLSTGPEKSFPSTLDVTVPSDMRLSVFVTSVLDGAFKEGRSCFFRPVYPTEKNLLAAKLPDGQGTPYTSHTLYALASSSGKRSSHHARTIETFESCS